MTVIEEREMHGLAAQLAALTATPHWQPPRGAEIIRIVERLAAHCGQLRRDVARRTDGK